MAIEKELSLIDCARLFALTAVARADALIAVFDAKYHYEFWRPVTAIRNGDIDGNPVLSATLPGNLSMQPPCIQNIRARTALSVPALPGSCRQSLARQRSRKFR